MKKATAKPFHSIPLPLIRGSLSHAHLDHSGRLPQLVRDGFKGWIHVHRAGRDIVEILLEDAAWLNTKEAEQLSRNNHNRGQGPIDPLYTAEDVSRCMESMAINRIQSGAIIIAGSGMCNGGRIRHHFKHQLGRSGTQVIIAGFQAEGTPGRQLVDGAPSITIWGESLRVGAQVHTVGGISAHADRDGLCDWLEGFRLPPKVALVHGEDSARQALAETLKERFTLDAVIPDLGEKLEY